MDGNEELMLNWSNHQPTLVHEVAALRHMDSFADVTLACENKLFKVHKFVLAMCSDYFRNIFASSLSNSNSNLIIILKDCTQKDLDRLLDFMYLGVIEVEKLDLPSLVKTAENLQIKGLAFPDGFKDEAAPSRGESNFDYQDRSSSNQLPRSAGSHVSTSVLNDSSRDDQRREWRPQDLQQKERLSPPAKRKRLDFVQTSDTFSNPNIPSSTESSNLVTTEEHNSVSPAAMNNPMKFSVPPCGEEVEVKQEHIEECEGEIRHKLQQSVSKERMEQLKEDVEAKNDGTVWTTESPSVLMGCVAGEDNNEECPEDADQGEVRRNVDLDELPSKMEPESPALFSMPSSVEMKKSKGKETKEQRSSGSDEKSSREEDEDEVDYEVDEEPMDDVSPKTNSGMDENISSMASTIIFELPEGETESLLPGAQDDTNDCDQPMEEKDKNSPDASVEEKDDGSSSETKSENLVCPSCGYVSISSAQMESHARELHPSLFSQLMRMKSSNGDSNRSTPNSIKYGKRSLSPDPSPDDSRGKLVRQISDSSSSSRPSDRPVIFSPSVQMLSKSASFRAPSQLQRPSIQSANLNRPQMQVSMRPVENSVRQRFSPQNPFQNRNPMQSFVQFGSLNQTAMVSRPSFQPHQQIQAFMQQRPTNQTLMQPRPTNQTLMQPRPANQTLMQPRPANQTLMQPRPTNQTLMQPRSANQTLMQLRPANQTLMQPRPANQTFMQSRPATKTITQPMRSQLPPSVSPQTHGQQLTYSPGQVRATYPPLAPPPFIFNTKPRQPSFSPSNSSSVRMPQPSFYSQHKPTVSQPRFSSAPPSQNNPNAPSTQSPSAPYSVFTQKDRNYSCPYCNLDISGTKALFDHVSMHATNDKSNVRNHWCPFCILKCSTLSTLNSHIVTHYSSSG